MADKSTKAAAICRHLLILFNFLILMTVNIREESATLSGHSQDWLFDLWDEQVYNIGHFHTIIRFVPNSQQIDLLGQSSRSSSHV